MDKRDKQILFELSRNARIGIKQLAKIIRLSESSTLYRIRNLYSNKTILNSYAVIDYSKLGYNSYRIYFNFVGTTTKIEKEIIDWLVQNQLTGIIGRSYIGIDIYIQSYLKSVTDFEELIRELKEKYGKYITNLDPSIYLKTYFYNRNYLTDSKDRSFYSNGNQDKVNFDNLDLKIINVLSNDARITKKQIASELNTLLRTIDYRIRKLEKEKVIISYSINIDRKKIGYDYYKIGFIFTENVNHEDLLGFAANIDNTIYIDYTLSRFDFEINLEVESYEMIDEIIGKLKDRFGGAREIAIYKLDQFYKMRFI